MALEAATTPGSPKDLYEALCYPGVLPTKERLALSAWRRTFFKFQREWLFEPSKFAMCNKARQIGMSHTTAGVAVLWAAFLGETTTVISIGEREATEVLDKAKKHAAVLVALGSQWAKPRTNNATELRLESGGRILAVPSSTGGRSLSGNIFIDEYAYLQHPEKVWDGAAAVTMHSGRMRVSSTPNGVGNAFHSLWTNPKQNKGWRKYEIPIERAIADGMRLKMDELWTMASGDARLFAQLFHGSFLDGSDQYLPTAIIDAAVRAETYVPEGECYAGLDIGLTNDLSSLTVVKQAPDGSVWEQVTETCKRTSWEDQMSMIARSFATYGWRRLCVDSTGLGAVPAQLLQREYGKKRVEPVLFSSQMKETLATTLYQSLADSMLYILDSKPMIKDLCSLRRTVTAAGNIRFDAPRTAEGHADRAWSLALAVHACGMKPGRMQSTGPGQYAGTV